jgi:hypothetical protein
MAYLGEIIVNDSWVKVSDILHIDDDKQYSFQNAGYASFRAFDGLIEPDERIFGNIFEKKNYFNYAKGDGELYIRSNIDLPCKIIVNDNS